MHMNLTRAAAAVLATLALVLASASPAMATPPSYDDISTPAVIAGLPYGPATFDTTEATASPDDPSACGYPPDGTIWLSYTAAQNEQITVHTWYSSYQPVIVVLTGPSSALTHVACASQEVRFNARAGTNYYLMVSVGNTYPYPSPTRSLQVYISSIPTPDNDDFGSARSIGSLPYDSTINLVASTIEPNEPFGCGWGGTSIGSAWYTFTPATTQSVTFETSYWFGMQLAVYTGSALSDLAIVPGACSSSRVTVSLQGGKPYFIQLLNLSGSIGAATFSAYPTPPLTLYPGFSPYDPSTFDTVSFFANTSDPVNAGVATETWTTPDGIVVGGAGFTRKFAADGDYPLAVTVTSVDGRSASAEITVQVRTRDVAITKFTVPQSARSGQTRQISVGVRNTRYPQSVTVTLYRSDPSGYVPVGSLTNAVPVRPSNRTTDFTFSYTFTAQDAALGKVTFRAVAQLNDGRDALPADNEAISLPTKIGK